MANEIAEVVKQYVMYVPNLVPPIKIKARISKFTGQDGKELYEWEISHHYGRSESSGAYIPTTSPSESFEDTERELKSYMNIFTTFSVTPTIDY